MSKMNKFLAISIPILIISILGYGAYAKPTDASSVDIEYFYSSDCQKCEGVDDAIQDIIPDGDLRYFRTKINYTKYDIFTEEGKRKAREYNIQDVPAIVVGRSNIITYQDYNGDITDLKRILRKTIKSAIKSPILDDRNGPNVTPSVTPITFGSISGYRFDDINRNRIIDPNEKGIPNARIRLIGIARKDGHIFRKETITDQQGFYKFSNLPVGRYILIQRMVKGYVHVGSSTKRILLESGKSVDNVNFLSRQKVSMVSSTPTIIPTVTPSMLKKLPQSIDQYYQSMPPMFMMNMLKLGSSFVGIIVNVEDGDMANAKNSSEGFFTNYNKTSVMVPEWSHYFNITLAEKLVQSVNAGNTSQIFQAVYNIGKTCDNCHRDNQPKVWAKYHAKDFRNVTINTTNPNESVLPWSDAKMMYLVTGFDGITTNAMEGQTDKAIVRFEQFRTMFNNMAEACTQCHMEKPKAFVGKDIKDAISDLGNETYNRNMTGIMHYIEKIGHNSCHQCHMVHKPSQILKEKLEN